MILPSPRWLVVDFVDPSFPFFLPFVHGDVFTFLRRGRFVLSNKDLALHICHICRSLFASKHYKTDCFLQHGLNTKFDLFGVMICHNWNPTVGLLDSKTQLHEKYHQKSPHFITMLQVNCLVSKPPFFQPSKGHLQGVPQPQVLGTYQQWYESPTGMILQVGAHLVNPSSKRRIAEVCRTWDSPAVALVVGASQPTNPCTSGFPGVPEIFFGNFV